MKVAMKNPRTGEIKLIKVGFSWVLLFFSGLLGIPLFLRRLHAWGAVMLALWVVNFFLPYVIPHPGDALFASTAVLLIALGLSIWLGVKGNEMTAKNYLEAGWQFADPTADNARLAKAKWGITL